MYKTVHETQEETKKTKDVKKQNDLDLEIEEILARIKALAETGWASIKSNQFSRMAIIPLCCAIRDRLAEVEDLVLENQDISSDPELREKIKWLRSVSPRKANAS